ncbi:MAG TPA: sulfate ABC transporter ATP-binding protein [Xanthobacteraceae bacterium]
MKIQVKNLRKKFETTLVLDHVNLEIDEREFIGLLGPSGSGKTTLLRILAGLEFPDAGAVYLDGQDALALGFEERQTGFVFQHYALFNHMSVFDNVAFGLKVRPRRKRPSSADVKSRVDQLLDLVQLTGLEKRFPGQLSGGQRQRVALARALAIDPKVLLLDEPFGALDAKVRVELRRSLREIHDATGLTTVFVTHDQEEALDLADRVAIMNGGQIEQIGTPVEIYEDPKTPFVFDFLGRTNGFDCIIEHGKTRLGNKTLPVEPGTPDGPGVAFVRPHDIVIAPAEKHANSDATLPGTAIVRFISALGQRAAVELLYDKRLIEAEIGRERLAALDLKTGDRCSISLRLPRVYGKTEVEQQTDIRSPREKRPRMRFRPRPRAAEKGAVG